MIASTIGGVRKENTKISTRKFRLNHAKTYSTVTIVFCAMYVPLKKISVNIATKTVLVTTPRAADNVYIA